MAGGLVSLSGGNFSISAPIIVKNQTSMVGTGWGTILTLANSANCNMFQADPSAAAGYLTIRDMNLDGNYSNNTSGSCFSLSAGQLHGDWYLVRLLMAHWPNDGFYIEAGWQIHLIDCIIEAVKDYIFHAKPTGTATTTNVRRIFIIGSGLYWNTVTGNTNKDGIYFEGGSGKTLANVQLVGNILGQVDIQKHIVHMKSVQGFAITGNLFVGASKSVTNTYDDIMIEDDDVAASTSGLISGNVFGNSIYTNDERYAISIWGLSNSIKIGANEYYGMNTADTYIASTCSNISNEIALGSRTGSTFPTTPREGEFFAKDGEFYIFM
jgi:hypothetical protein